MAHGHVRRHQQLLARAAPAQADRLASHNVGCASATRGAAGDSGWAKAPYYHATHGRPPNTHSGEGPRRPSPGAPVSPALPVATDRLSHSAPALLLLFTISGTRIPWYPAAARQMLAAGLWPSTWRLQRRGRARMRYRRWPATRYCAWCTRATAPGWLPLSSAMAQPRTAKRRSRR